MKLKLRTDRNKKIFGEVKFYSKTKHTPVRNYFEGATPISVDFVVSESKFGFLVINYDVMYKILTRFMMEQNFKLIIRGFKNNFE